MGLHRLFYFIGIGGGLAVAIVGLTHLWPVVTPTPGYNTMLHALTSWVLLPLGLIIAIRDSDKANVIGSPAQFLGSHFAPLFDFLASDHRYTVVLIWAGLTCLSFDGMAGILGFLLLLLRAGTMFEPVEKAIDHLLKTLEDRGINIPGITNSHGE